MNTASLHARYVEAINLLTDLYARYFEEKRRYPNALMLPHTMYECLCVFEPNCYTFNDCVMIAVDALDDGDCEPKFFVMANRYMSNRR